MVVNRLQRESTEAAPGDQTPGKPGKLCRTRPGSKVGLALMKTNLTAVRAPGSPARTALGLR